MKKTITAICVTSVMSVFAYTGIATVTSVAGISDAEARRMGSRSSSSFSRPAPRPAPAPVTTQRATPTPAPSPVASPRAAPAQQSSMIGSNVRPATAAAPAPMMSRSAIPPANRTFNSSPAQRASAGSMVQPFLMGVGGAIAGSMLMNWLMAPSAQAAAPNTAPATDAAAKQDTGGLNIVKPAANFKVFEGANIPAEFQEKMKANGVNVEPKQGQITEYSKTIKVEGGIDVKVDVVDLPVLVVYKDISGKPAHDLYMPL